MSFALSVKDECRRFLAERPEEVAIELVDG